MFSKTASKLSLHAFKFVDHGLRQHAVHGPRPLLIVSPRKTHKCCAIIQHHRGLDQTRRDAQQIGHFVPQAFGQGEVFLGNLNNCGLTNHGILSRSCSGPTQNETPNAKLDPQNSHRDIMDRRADYLRDGLPLVFCQSH